MVSKTLFILFLLHMCGLRTALLVNAYDTMLRQKYMPQMMPADPNHQSYNRAFDITDL